MPPEKEIVGKYLDVLGGDTLDEAAEYWHPDIDWRAIEGAPDDIGVFHGPQAMRDYYEQWNEAFEDIRLDLVEDLIDAGDEVIAVVRVTARMKESDAEVDMNFAIVIKTREGKIAGGREYATRELALEAAGLTK
jgi:ketosteroid isomerase-like protein